MKNHTPTPWRIDQNVMRGANGDAIYAHVNGRLVGDENAEFIVRAVNSHEALLSALRDAIHDLKAITHSYGGVVGENPDLPRYEAALAQAEAK